MESSEFLLNKSSQKTFCLMMFIYMSLYVSDLTSAQCNCTSTDCNAGDYFSSGSGTCEPCPSGH